MDGPDLDHQRQSFDAVATSARLARQFAAELLTRHGAPADVTRDFTLVVSELVTNFVEHSNGARVEVSLDLSDRRWWQVEVSGGSGAASKQLPAPETWTLAAAGLISGRGLGIVRQLMDHVVVDVDIPQGRVSVRCRRRRSPGPGPR